MYSYMSHSWYYLKFTLVEVDMIQEFLDHLNDVLNIEDNVENEIEVDNILKFFLEQRQ